MKITSVDVYMLDAGVQRAKRRPVVCRIHTDDGLYGDGEAGVAYGIGAPGAYGALCDLARLVVGKDPMNVDPIWYDMMKTTFWGAGGGALFYAAMSALDIALMDLKGKILGVPCYQLLGGKFRSDMRVYASQLQFGWEDRQGPYGKPEEYVQIVEYALSKGYDAVKIDFTYFDRDGKFIKHLDSEGILSNQFMDMVEERMAAVRGELGYGFDIIVENHCRTDTTGGVQIGTLCDKYRIMAYEEACMPLNPDLQRELRDKVKTPLAAGERIYTRWGYRNFFVNNSIQMIQPDICNCGGLSEAKRICDMAEPFDVCVQAHVAGSPISTAAALHLQAAIPKFCIHEHHFRSTQPAISCLCKYDYQPKDGKYTVPDLPGLGQELADTAIQNALKHDHITDSWTEE